MSDVANVVQGDFPFVEMRDAAGDYFRTATEAANYFDVPMENVWSVSEIEDDDNAMVRWFIYGPAHHYVNVIGYVVTVERHDTNTYYEEKLQYDD